MSKTRRFEIIYGVYFDATIHHRRMNSLRFGTGLCVKVRSTKVLHLKRNPRTVRGDDRNFFHTSDFWAFSLSYADIYTVGAGRGPRIGCDFHCSGRVWEIPRTFLGSYEKLCVPFFSFGFLFGWRTLRYTYCTFWVCCGVLCRALQPGAAAAVSRAVRGAAAVRAPVRRLVRRLPAGTPPPALPVQVRAQAHLRARVSRKSPAPCPGVALWSTTHVWPSSPRTVMLRFKVGTVSQPRFTGGKKSVLVQDALKME